MKAHLVFLSMVVCALLLVPAASQAQYTCGTVTYPQCDGTCPPGDACGDPFNTGMCECVPVGSLPACGMMSPPFGPPNCWGGDCPPSQPICADLSGTGAGPCACIPTLSRWGMISMLLAMLVGVIILQRRKGRDVV